MNVGRYRHTTHDSRPAQICYRHHPQFGSPVDIVRRLRREHEEQFIVNLPDDSRIAVPGWMLDPLVCEGLQEATSPQIAIEALLALRTLIDAQPLPSPSRTGSSGASPLEDGDSDAEQGAHTTPSTNVSAPEHRDALGAAASRDARAVSSARGSASHPVGSRRLGGRKR